MKNIAQYNDDDLKMVTSTARASGAVGSNALVPRVVEALQLLDVNKRVLDYGAGPKAVQTMALRAKGFDVWAHDVNEQKTDWHVSPELSAHALEFDIVFASNVVNVQPTADHVRNMIEEVERLLRDGGSFVVNYPASPRKSGLTVKQVSDILLWHFPTVIRIREIGDWKISSPVWQCIKERS